MANTRASIRYTKTNPNLPGQWEASEDTAGGDASFKAISLAGHEHVSAEITDATSAPTASKVAIRDSIGGIAFASITIGATSESAATAALNASRVSVGLQDPSMGAQGQVGISLRVNGGSPPFKTVVNDGAYVTQLINATRGVSVSVGNTSYTPAYVVAGPAVKVAIGAADWSFSTALSGLAGNPITWNDAFWFASNVFGVGQQSAPTFAVTLEGNAVFKNRASALAFDVVSAAATKESVEVYAPSALEELAKLLIVSYTYRADEQKVPRVGIIADNTENTLISGPDHNKFDLANVVALLVKAVQELGARK